VVVKSHFALPLALILIAGCSKPALDDVDQGSDPLFIGTADCVSCHQQEYDSWQGSHHQLAMQVATEETVLGDFSGAEFEYFDTTTRFFMRDDAFIVRTQNASGEEQDYEVTHAFGVDPLQQYLVDYPGGRKQSLPFTWDSRPADAGGQRWYHLYGDEYIAPDDELHWTGQYFNWNTACAECHSTDVRVGYDAGSDSFETTFAEISVGCEACHGPGSTHAAQAKSERFDEDYGLYVDLDDRKNAAWIMNQETGIAERSEPVAVQQQPESCGRCHARRGMITSEYEYGKPLTDTHMPSLLVENLYHADGRIQDEVYVYGSFLQSKMYAAGVTCSDCHNSHSGALHTGPDPNDVCAQCHLPTKFASTNHNESDVGNCVDCHMPATTYMGVDDRRDHSFRLPAAGESSDHYGAAIAAGREGDANAVLAKAITINDYPAIAQATILTLLEPPLTDNEATLLLGKLDDPDPLIRIGALRSLRNQDPELQMRAGSHLLRDSVRGVRIEAALTYVEYRDLLPIEDARAFQLAANDYRAAMKATLDRPLSAINLAEFESRNGEIEAAGKYYAHAISIGPRFAAARHAYGLFLVRSGQSDSALSNLEAAAILEPENSRYAYVFGIALNSLGQSDRAIESLSRAHVDFPEDFDIGWALATILRDTGDRASALQVALDMWLQFPNNEQIGSLIYQLRP
jgi:Tfp pilus assembly protein PilF